MDGLQRVEQMSDFLLELRSEEIPARMQKSARAELERLFAAQMAIAGLDGAGLDGAGLGGAGLGGAGLGRAGLGGAGLGRAGLGGAGLGGAGLGGAGLGKAGLGGAGLGRAGLGGAGLGGAGLGGAGLGKAGLGGAGLGRAGLGGAGLGRGAVTSWSTPRRVVLIARGLPVKTAAVSKRVKGPRIGSPPRALEGFLRKVEQTRDQLTQQDGIWFAEISGTARATAEVLAQAVPAIIRAFNWPKSMRWGAASQTNESLRWVRPLSGIIALLGDDIVACEVDGIIAGRETKGHRFHYHGGGEGYGEGRGVGRSGGDISIANAADYAPKLRAAHVIVDQDERAAIIRDGASQAASQAGLALIEDERLVLENAGLTEWPVPLLGRFERDFLSLPPEVIRLTARANQKYFTLSDHKGKLANAFVCTANIAASDGGAALVAGNEKVLAARLADARFFWEQDRKISLAERAKKLEKIIFHAKIGTLADKAQRVASLAHAMAKERFVSGADAEQAKQAALLCKADLATAMVGEFPELQGVMGGYYAQAEGYAPQVVTAIRDHYKPAGQSDDVPTAPLTVALSLADKLDTLSLFFLHGLVPSGSKDPYALRRIANGIIEIILQNQLRISLAQPIMFSLMPFIKADREIDLLFDFGVSDEVIESERDGLLEKTEIFDSEVMLQERLHPIARAVMAFLAERLKVQQREAGVRHDLIDAVFALAWAGDLVLLLARVKALQTFVETSNGANLLAGYKRAANILGKAGWGEQAGDKTDSEQDEKLSKASPPNLEAVNLEPSEIRLIEALGIAEAKVDSALAKENFTGAMNSLASLREPIDNFFENTMVNDPDPAIRVRRLSLLARFRAAAHRVADFSKIEVQK